MIVVFSTLNGRARLGALMDALLRVHLPAGVQFHAVDNDSQDDTAGLLASYVERLPLTIHFQSKRGKNACLNLALDLLTGRLDPDELIVFTDDDVVPSPDWLEALADASRAHPECDVFAGRIEPQWPDICIKHLKPLRPHFDVLFSLTSNRDGPCDCALAWGPNMAVRAKVFKAGLRFDPRFGPNGGSAYAMGSETELMERLDAAGHRAWFVERSVVRHVIRAAQLTPDSVLRRAFRHGYGVGWRQQRGAGTGHALVSLIAAFKGLICARFRALIKSEPVSPLDDFREAWAAGLAQGTVHEYRRARKASKTGETFPDVAAEPRSTLAG